jgi:hypothetical protein
MTESPKYLVTVVSTRGMISRSAPTPTAGKSRDLPVGSVHFCYEITSMMDGVLYARLSPVGVKPEWARVQERDGSIVYLTYAAYESEASQIIAVLNRIAIALEKQ